MPAEPGTIANVWAMDEDTPSDTSSPTLGNLVRSGSKRMLNAIAPKDTSSLRRDLVKNKPAPGASTSADAAPFSHRQNSFLGLSPRKPKPAAGSRNFDAVRVSSGGPSSAATSPRGPAPSGLVGGSEATGGKKQTLAELVRQKRAEKEEREKAGKATGSPENVTTRSEFEKGEVEEEEPADVWNLGAAVVPTKRFSKLLK